MASQPKVSAASAESQSGPMQAWIKTARPGSLFLDQAKRLYAMTYFHHVRVEEPLATALIHKDRLVMERILRNQKVIRWLFGYSAVVTVMLIATTYTVYVALNK